jgi:uncharacterized DUF497 family protein
MNEVEFEWDDAKAAQNYADHGVSFEAAKNREDYGEDRYSILGMVEGRILYVAYTLRNGTIRIISARGAEPHERRRYHEDNA